MKLLKDYPIIYRLLTSSNEDDIRIGAELLIKEDLSIKELKYMLPHNICSDKDRDIKSNLAGEMEIKIKGKYFLYVNSSWVMIIKEEDE